SEILAFVHRKRNGISLQHGNKDKKYFVDLSVGMNPIYERFDVEDSRADAVYGRDHATEDMIQTIVLCGIFDGHDITDIFHDTDDVAVALRTAAYRALFVVGNIVTRSAKTDLRSEPV